MSRGVLFGFVWGAILSGTSLAVISLLVPPPLPPGSAADAVADTAAAASPPKTLPALATPQPAETGPAAPDMGAAAPATAAAPVPAAPAPSEPEPTQSVPSQSAAAVEPAAVPDTVAAGMVEEPHGSEFTRERPDVAPVLPGTEAAPADAGTGAPVAGAPEAPPSGALSQAATDSAPRPEAGSAAPSAMAAPSAEGSAPERVAMADAPSVPMTSPGLGGQPAAPEAAPAPDVAPDAMAAAGSVDGARDGLSRAVKDALAKAQAEAGGTPAPEPAAEPEAAAPPEPAAPAENASPLPQIIQPDGSQVIPPEPPIAAGDAGTASARPVPGFGNRPVPGFGQASGVAVNRLPRVGDAAPAADPAADALPEAVPADGPALERYAQPFDAPAGKPLFSVVLIDVGESAGGLDPATLTTLPFPVTIALDPLRAEASDREAAFRAAGYEVAILAAGLPPMAKAADLDVSWQGFRAVLPEAIAVLDDPAATLQNNRMLAKQLVVLAGEGGLGLLTWNKGLNPARQIAAGENLPQAQIYRLLDSEGESMGMIGRYLDRAAFEAGRDGSVVVVGTTRPDTVTALIAWAAKGADAVAVAPLSAVLMQGR